MTDEAAAIHVHGVQQRDDILGQTGGADQVDPGIPVGQHRPQLLQVGELSGRRAGALREARRVQDAGQGVKQRGGGGHGPAGR